MGSWTRAIRTEGTTNAGATHAPTFLPIHLSRAEKWTVQRFSSGIRSAMIVRRPLPSRLEKSNKKKLVAKTLKRRPIISVRMRRRSMRARSSRRLTSSTGLARTYSVWPSPLVVYTRTRKLKVVNLTLDCPHTSNRQRLALTQAQPTNQKRRAALRGPRTPRCIGTKEITRLRSKTSSSSPKASAIHRSTTSSAMGARQRPAAARWNLNPWRILRATRTRSSIRVIISQNRVKRSVRRKPTASCASQAEVHSRPIRATRIQTTSVRIKL